MIKGFVVGTSEFFRKRLKDVVWLRVAFDIAALGACSRRKVGVVFLDKKGRILASGYNGTAPGAPHCTDSPCAGAHMPSGEGLELCEAIHAEQNALVQCKFPDEVDTVYSTDSPCIHCAKMLASTAARRVVFGRGYPHATSKDYWMGLGREWVHLPEGVPGKSIAEAVGIRVKNYLPHIIAAFLSGTALALFVSSVVFNGGQ